ncbi:hypothetical protein DL240_08230 [Lujinxingia litoralis]|uniref:non-specific serine/threonine protein kinase n=1 Tax=Lujinxingia litoralis TaxID=2211119 RepID=A0A328C871_9DELT|nr:RCC1 domain-containing protein [Lujinxingia litoralis]RAL22870.1 hypothetical protein DL240_08230 [Lujinxingia litoralis]
MKIPPPSTWRTILRMQQWAGPRPLLILALLALLFSPRAVALVPEGVTPPAAEDFTRQNPYTPLSPHLLFPAPTPTLVVAADWSCRLDESAALSCQGPGVDRDLTRAPIARLVSGLRHICALDILGQLLCIGDNTHAQTALPTETYIDLAAGDRFTCALTSRGQLRCAGTHVQGPMRAPEGTFSQVVATPQFACALSTAGKPLCWGANLPGNLDAPAERFVLLQTRPPQVCGVTSRGHTQCWGAQHAPAPTP